MYADAKSPLLNSTDNKKAAISSISNSDQPPASKPPKSAKTATSTIHILNKYKSTLKRAKVGNYTFLQNQWTAVKQNSSLLSAFTNLTTSKRRDVDIFTGKNETWDTIKNGYFKTPNLNYNPFVRVSLIRASAENDNDDDNDNGDQKQPETANENVNVRTTLPIYNGGHNVSLRKCDRNTFEFDLKDIEWLTSWLSFEIWDDKILTHSDDFIGAVSIDISGIKDVGQTYYTQLPLINKQNYSRLMQMKAEKEYQEKQDMDKDKEKGGYQQLHQKVDDAKDIMMGSKDDITANDDNTAKKIVDGMVENNKHLNITGILHIKAIKKLKGDNIGDIFDENEDEDYNLEIEILAITNMITLKLEASMDKRKFWWGLLFFIAYLLFYALIMFVAEYHVSTGMNEYKESIWFALITVTTLGYGDIVAQTPYSRVLNSFFIFFNIFVVATFVGNLLGYIVDSGEESLNNRMDHMMNGAHDVFRNKEEIEKDKLDKMAAKKKKETDNDKQRSQSLHIAPSDIKGLSSTSKLLKSHDRRFSEPVLPGVDEMNEKDELNEEEKEEQIQKQVEVVKSVEVQTAKATKLKLDELMKLDDESHTKFKNQIWLNICLFFLVLLFGFFTLGVAILLKGPNFLTNLPYPGYDCDTDYNSSYCSRHIDDATAIFIDSLYYTIVSMSTVGYGDIYPKPSAGARILGSLFILFGTMMLVRLLDLVSGYMVWQHNMAKKAKCLGQILTSSKEFFEFDINNDGKVNKYEFLRGMLLKLDIVDSDRIDEIMVIFNETDKNGDGEIEMEELKEKVKEDQMKLKWGEDAWIEIKKEWNSIESEKENIKIEKNKLKKDMDELNKKQQQFKKDKIKWEKERKKKEIIDVIKEEESKEASITDDDKISDLEISDGVHIVIKQNDDHGFVD